MRRRFPTILATVLSSLASTSPAPGHTIPAAATDAQWLRDARAEILRREYDLRPLSLPGDAGAPVAHHAPNRAQRFGTIFSAEGVRVVPRTAPSDQAPAWEWGLAFRGLGRGSAMAQAPCTGLRAAGHRAELRRGDLTEWYVNDERGLEQGFTLLRPPAPGTLPDGSPAPLRLEMSVTGSLIGRVGVTGADGARSIDFLAPGGATAIRLAHLRAWDATMRELAAGFELDGATLSIVVGDAGATYPIHIDPLATSPDWTAEGQQAAAGFGISAAAAGDVNGDGYGDVIVGAHLYDYSPAGNDGVAFLFQGTPAGLSTSYSWARSNDQDGSEFGIAVSAAGDVNGDGFGDVIVGAYLFSGDYANEGAAYVYHGSPTGLQEEPGWTVAGGQDGAYYGLAVGAAGDVNGDGYSDVVVAAPFFDNPFGVDGGRAYVYLGSARGLQTQPETNWFGDGDQTGALFGSAVAGAGDVDGDGYGDVVVGASSYDTTGGLHPDAGRVYFFRGMAGGLTLGAAWVLDNLQDGARYGSSVAAAGDVNGDGYGDVIIGAPNHEQPVVETNEGRVEVRFGSATGPLTLPAWSAGANQTHANLGASVGSAGDVNGDGYADVIAGAPGFDDEGAAFVWLGSAAGLGPFGTPANADWSAQGDQADSAMGGSVASAGDVDGDGVSEVLVGAFNYDNGQANEGRVYAYHGLTAGPAAAPGWSAEGEANHARMGPVASAGDVNGDGWGDVIVAAPNFDGPDSYEGRVFVYHGSATGIGTTPGWIAESNEPNAWFGAAVAAAGDVNGDGYGDVIVGAPYFDNSLGGQGAVFVWLGSASGLGADGTPQNADWIAETDSLQIDGMGTALAGAGDVNGDGYGDVILGLPSYDDGAMVKGLALVWLGSSSGLGLNGTPHNADWSAQGGQPSSAFGTSVASAGDVDGDGYGDVIVGAPYHQKGQFAPEGGAFVWLGSAAGLGPDGDPVNADWSAQSNLENADFGRSVASAGDVNGDGFSDVIIGAPGVNYGSSAEGAAFVWAGSAAGLGPDGFLGNHDWSAEGNQAEALLGTAVATAGDVNRDGFSDVVVGAPGYGANQGGAFVWLGSETGLGQNGGVDTADWLIDGPSGGLGTNVASAGDVNGDGASDVLVGAPGFDGGDFLEGAAFLHYGNDGPGSSLNPRQRQADDASPIAHLGRATGNLFRIALLARSPLGRGLVRLEWEAKPAGMPFDGTGLQQGAAWADTGTAGAALSELVGGLGPGTAYHWRARVLHHASSSPFQQRGPWMSPHGNGWNETDLRTALLGDANGDGTIDVADMVLVILNWGVCDGLPCAGDVNGDMVVDVNDLVAVVLGWT